MKFAIIGTGFITESFLQEASFCKGFEPTALVSRSLEHGQTFALKYGIPEVYDSLDEVIHNEAIEAAYIASPNSFHMPQAIRFLKTGKHVLCEKPIASNVAEFQKMLDCAEKNGALLLEAMRTAFDPSLRSLKNLISEMGKPRRAVLIYCHYSSRYDRFKNGEDVNTFNPSLSNSALMDLGVYCVRLMLELFGVPSKIQAANIKLQNGFEGSGTICASYPEMTTELLYSKIADSHVCSEIQFENGSILIQDVARLSGISIIRGGKTVLLPDDSEFLLLPEIKEFIRLTGNREEARRYNRMSLETLRILDEARRQGGVIFPADQDSNEG